MSHKHLSIQSYTEVIRWYKYCEYYLLAYIVKHKLTVKHQTNKAAFEKEHGFINKVRKFKCVAVKRFFDWLTFIFNSFPRESALLTSIAMKSRDSCMVKKLT